MSCKPLCLQKLLEIMLSTLILFHYPTGSNLQMQAFRDHTYREQANLDRGNSKYEQERIHSWYDDTCGLGPGDKAS